MSWTYPFPTGPFVRGYAIGGGGGFGFQIHQISQGKLVRTVGIHYNNQYLRGIRLTYTDGTRSPLVGSAVQNYEELTLQPGETIVRASLWGNGIGTRTGRIDFTTSRGNRLNVGRDTRGQTEYGMDVGSGILVGFAGRANVDIDALSFIFLLQGFNVEISNVRYTRPPTNDSIGQVLLAPQAIFRNQNNTQPINWVFRNTVTRTNTWAWSQATAFNFTHNVNVRAGLFNLVKVESNTTWELSVESRRETTVSVEVAMGWDLSGVLQPGEALIATSTADSGQADVPYIATVTISAPGNNNRIVYQENGVLENAVYLQAEATARKLEQGHVAATSEQEEHHPDPKNIVESSDLVAEETDAEPPRSSAEHATETSSSAENATETGHSAEHATV